MRHTKNTMKSVSMVAMLAVMPASVYAQDEKKSDVDEVEEIIVTGIRGSAQRQRDAKKMAKNISDGIFAEDIGVMPDENIAEAMQRITGIGINRVDGEGQSITIRGVEPSLNTITINGMMITNGGDDNAVDFSSMSADMLKSIEVIKSPSADHDEGSLGGSVRLKTFRPLNLKKRRITGSAQLKKNDLATGFEHIIDDADLALKASYADKFNDDRVGVVLSAFYDENTTRTDYFNIYQWQPFKNVLATDAETGEDLGKIFSYEPKGFEPGVKFNERVRYGGNFTFEVAPDDVSTIAVDLSYSMLVNDFDSHQTRVTFLNKGNVKDDNGDLIPQMWDSVSGSLFNGNAKTSGNVLSKQSDTETETIMYGLTYQRDMGEWQIEAKVSRSQTTQDYIKNRRVNFKPSKENITFSWLDDNGAFQDIPTMTGNGTNGSSPTGFYDPEKVRLYQLYDDSRSIEDTYTQASFDVDRFVDWGPVTSLKFGVKYFERSKFRSQTTGNTPFSKDPDGNRVFLADYALDFPVDDFLDSQVDNALDGWLVPDFDAIYSTYLEDGWQGGIDELNTGTTGNKAFAAYAMANYEAMDGRLSGDFGVRFVNSSGTAFGKEGINFPASNGGNSAKYSVEEAYSYSQALPSFNARYTLADDKLIRFSVARVMARPKASQLRPGLVIKATNSTNVTGRGGNPYLSPTLATQYDASFEWYFGDTGMVSAAVFYKDISTFIVDGVQHEIIPCPDGTSVDDCAVIDGLDIPITRPYNGSGGSIYGVEVSWQQDFTFLPGELKNFGAIVNYTYANSDASFVADDSDNAEYYNNFPFLATSKDTFNGTLYWQKGGHSVRLAYNYRSARLVRPVVITSSVWSDPRQSLDFSAKFKLNEVMNLSLQAVNLTNEGSRDYATRTIGEKDVDGNVIRAGEGNALTGDAPDWRTSYYSHSGRTFRIGVNASF